MPDTFGILKDEAKALLFVFRSTYLCKQIFLHMKFVLSPHRSRLTVDNSEACVQLKVTNYKPNIKGLSAEKQGRDPTKIECYCEYSCIYTGCSYSPDKILKFFYKVNS